MEYIEGDVPREAISILRNAGFKNIIIFDHHYEHNKRVVKLLVDLLANRDEKGIVIFSYMDAKYIRDAEQLLFHDQIVVFNDVCEAFMDYKDIDCPSTFIIVNDKKLPIAVYRKNNLFIVQTNDITHSCADKAKIEVIAQLVALLSRYDDKISKDVGIMVSIMKAISTSARIAPIKAARIDSGIDGVDITLRIDRDYITANVEVKGVKILGVAACNDLEEDCDEIYHCAVNPPLYANITMKWQHNGKFVKIRGSGYALYNDKRVPHENIECVDRECNICTGTWKPPNLDLDVPIDVQIRRIVAELINILQYPNTENRYREGIGEIILLSNGKCSAINEWVV